MTVYHVFGGLVGLTDDFVKSELDRGALSSDSLNEIAKDCDQVRVLLMVCCTQPFFSVRHKLEHTTVDRECELHLQWLDMHKQFAGSLDRLAASPSVLHDLDEHEDDEGAPH